MGREDDKRIANKKNKETPLQTRPPAAGDTRRNAPPVWKYREIYEKSLAAVTGCLNTAWFDTVKGVQCFSKEK